MFPSSQRPFSPSGSLAPSAPHHVRRTSGSAGGSSFLAENLGFGRPSQPLPPSTSTPPSSASNPLSRSPQQRPSSASSSAFLQQQQQLALQQLSFKLEPSPLSNPSSSSTSSTSSTPQSSHRSSFPMSQLSHAQNSLNSLKRSSLPAPSSSSSSSTSSSLHHSPQPPYPHPSSLSSSTTSLPPTTHLKAKRKIRKNTREKQRRSELNEKFDELQALLQLGGGQTKVEKFAVLSEAIGVIEQLKKENGDLLSERKELREERRKMTGVLEGFWPQNPEMAKEFAAKFFPRLTAMSPQGSLGSGGSGFGSGGGGDGGTTRSRTEGVWGATTAARAACR